MADFNQSPSGQATLVLALPELLLGLGENDPSVLAFRQNISQPASAGATLPLPLPEVVLGLGESDPSVLVFRQNIAQSASAGATLTALMPAPQMTLGSSDTTLYVSGFRFFIPGTPTILFQLQTETPEPPQIPPTGQIYPRGYY